MADVKFLLNCIYRNLFDKLYFISKLKHRTVHCSWHAVLLCFLPEQTSALTRKSTSTSTTALFTAISTEAVTPLAATCSAALVVLFCAYGRDLYTGLTCNILVLHSCTVYRLYTFKVAVHKLVKHVWKWLIDDDGWMIIDGESQSVGLVH